MSQNDINHTAFMMPKHILSYFKGLVHPKQPWDKRKWCNTLSANFLFLSFHRDVWHLSHTS